MYNIFINTYLIVIRTHVIFAVYYDHGIGDLESTDS